MSDTDRKSKSFQEKLFDKYRVVVLDDDTLGEVRSTRISPVVLLMSLLSLMLLAGLLTAALISYTPLRYLVPGYADVNNNKTYVEITEKIKELEAGLDAQRVYTKGIQNLLNPSEVQINESSLKASNFRNNSNKGPNHNNSSMDLSIEHYYFCTPLKGEVSAEFDLENKHFGVDIVAEKDSPVKSVLDGHVISADRSVNTGNTISIQHSNDLISVYKHNSVLLKKVGQQVKAGEAIAIIGNTGILTSGPHVHFELWKKGVAVNPREYINL